MLQINKLIMLFSSLIYVLFYCSLNSDFTIDVNFSNLTKLNLLQTFPIISAFYLISFLEYFHIRGILYNINNKVSGNVYTYKINLYETLVNKLPFIILLLLINYNSFIFISMNYGVIFSVLFYLKGIIDNSKEYENKPSYNIVHDFYNGIQSNVRFKIFDEDNIDLKIYFFSHIGLSLWHLLNIRNAIFGIKNNTCIPLIITILQGLYILFYTINEKWLINIINKYYGRLGFYLCFGSCALVPSIFCNYTYYTSNNIVNHSYIAVILYILLYLFGLKIFVNSNMEKFMFKKGLKKQSECLRLYYLKNGVFMCDEFLICKNTWWCHSRYINYFGEILMVLSLSLLCGFNHILPHIYTFLVIILIFKRINYNEKRYQNKYKLYWEIYKEHVPYKLIPYIY